MKIFVQLQLGNNTYTDKVSSDGCEYVADFKKAIKIKFTPLLNDYSASQLTLFEADGITKISPKLSIDKIQLEYEENGEQKSLLVHISTSTPSTTTPEISLPGKEPHPKRKQRWEQLNEILAKNKKKSKTTDSTGYSYVSWNQVKSVLRTTPYTQTIKIIPDKEFNVLSQYLSFATKCFGPFTTSNDSKRLHLIAPIIVCICFLFNGDVQIEVEDLDGDFLKAHGHFEFVLCRGERRVCIVEAKKDDMGQGMAQDLLGCEVAAEIGHLDSVYGIVTNYVQWNFLRSLDERIELEECVMEIGIEGPVQASLLNITGKIYSMLSDD